MTQRTITNVVHGFTKRGRIPYASAILDCGHDTDVVVLPTVRACSKCEHQYTAGYKCPKCGSIQSTTAWSANPHLASDRLTNVGDVVACETCLVRDRKLVSLRHLDWSQIAYARHKYDQIHVYRSDHKSPTGVILCLPVEDTPEARSILHNRITTISPTE